MPVTSKLKLSNHDNLIPKEMESERTSQPSVLYNFWRSCEDMESFAEEGLLPTTITFIKFPNFRALKHWTKMGLTSSLLWEDWPEIAAKTCRRCQIWASNFTLAFRNQRMLFVGGEIPKEGGNWNKIARISLVWINQDFIISRRWTNIPTPLHRTNFLLGTCSFDLLFSPVVNISFLILVSSF